MPVSRDFFYTSLRVPKKETRSPDKTESYLSLRFPGKGAPPPPCSSSGALMERDALSPEPEVYSFFCISQSLHLRSAPKKWGENIQPMFTEPHMDGRPTYNGVQTGSPGGSFTTLLSQPQCHATFITIASILAWVDQSPVTQHVL